MNEAVNASQQPMSIDRSIITMVITGKQLSIKAVSQFNPFNLSTVVTLKLYPYIQPLHPPNRSKDQTILLRPSNTDRNVDQRSAQRSYNRRPDPHKFRVIHDNRIQCSLNLNVRTPRNPLFANTPYIRPQKLQFIAVYFFPIQIKHYQNPLR